MKVLAIIGSPRKGGNTDILVEKFLHGCAITNHELEKVYLYKHNISPCIACSRCKKGDYTCTIKDDMQSLYPLLDEADMIVFGTPNYWFGPSAKTKLLIDRLRPYTSNKKLKGKKASLIVAAADGPEACGPMVEMFKLSFNYLGIGFIGSVLGTAYEKREILNDKRAIDEAYKLGKEALI